ncbi:MAG: hypothetical protein ACR2LK_00640 [Solirubrobacteraceae bacterium]
MSYLIVFRASPDVDHMAPLAWKLLEQGETVHAVMSVAYDVDADHRLALLRGYPSFHMHELRPRGRDGLRERLSQRTRVTLPRVAWFLRQLDVELVAVEWGYGLAAGYDRLRSTAGARAVLGSLVGSLRRCNDPRQPRASFIVAARLLGIPVVCLPHGLSVKLDAASNHEAAALIAAGALDWRDRNRFDAYVLNTEHHRQIHLEHARGDPDVMHTWGSLRWSPEWFEINLRSSPPFAWPAGEEGHLRVVFMVPKWQNRVDAPAAIELVRRLQAVEGVSLAVMGHPRSLGEDSDVLRSAPGIDWEQIHDLSGRNSVSVIREADVVIDVGSSIGLEVVLQDKVLVNPSYLHEIRTLFDAVEGAAVIASDAGEVIDYLVRHRDGDAHRIPAGAREELLRHAVYGTREPYDVAQLYCERLRALVRC